MTHSCVLSSAEMIAALRNETVSGKVESDVHIVPGLYFNWDTEHGDVAIEASSEPGTLLHIRARLRSTPQWFTLNLSLGAGGFAPGDVLGLVWEMSGNGAFDLSPFIRSSDAGSLADTDLEDALHVTAAPAVGVTLHTVRPEDGLSWTKDYHTLVLRLPMQDFELKLTDLRFFVIPASRGLHTQPATLANPGY